MPLTIKVVEAPVTIRPITYRTVATESLTVDATASGVRIDTGKINDKTVRASLGPLETAQVRWQLQLGLIITAGGTEGSPLAEIGDILILEGNANILNARFIRTGGTSGLFQVLLQEEDLAVEEDR